MLLCEASFNDRICEYRIGGSNAGCNAKGFQKCKRWYEGESEGGGDQPSTCHDNQEKGCEGFPSMFKECFRKGNPSEKYLKANNDSCKLVCEPISKFVIVIRPIKWGDNVPADRAHGNTNEQSNDRIAQKQAFLEGVAHESNDGEVLEGHQSAFDLPKGVRNPYEAKSCQGPRYIINLNIF